MKRSLRAPLAPGVFALGMIVLAGSASAQRGQEALSALRSGTIYVEPGLSNFKIDTGRVESAANTVKPLQLKVLVVKTLSGRWMRNGQERRGAFAQVLLDQLKLGDQGISIVITQKGIIGYNSRLSQSRLSSLGSQASSAVGRDGDFTSGVITLAQNISSEVRSGGSTGRTSSSTTYGRTPTAAASTGTSLVMGTICIGIPVLIGIALFISSRRAKAKRLEAAKQEAIRGKDAATDAIAYVDSYDGLISGPASDAVRQYRARMGESYEQGLSALQGAQNEVGYGQAKRHFTQALTDFQASQKQIELATGGTGIAYKIPPSLTTGGTDIAPMLEPVKGVSFFSSEPSDNLVPVEININGQRRTVMVTTAERDEFQQGRVPPIVGRTQNGQFQPWYDVNDYDPRRDYGRHGRWDDLSYSSPWGMGGYGGGWGRYGGGGFGDGFSGLLAGMALGSLFSGHHGGYGYGGYGYGGGYGDTTIINNYGDGNLGDNLNSNDFGSGGDFSGGGFDFGGGDSGGSDVGGGDFGGGGFDFGGGDSGGGFDFGGGGDSGGGGGDW